MNGIALDTQAVLAFPLSGARLIEASAGTGKTYTIANLYLRHILAGREVGQVLVVTFTTAATDELRGRIRARLFQTLELLEAGGDTDDTFLAALVARLREQDETDIAIRRLRLAVRAMDEAAIYTIHGFCQRCLAELAFESGQSLESEVLTDDRELWRQAVQDWWRRTGYPLDRPQARLFRASLGDLEGFRERLSPLLSAQTLRLLPAPEPLDEVLARLRAIEPALTALARQWRSEGGRLKRILTESKGLSRAQKGNYHPDGLAPALARLDAYFAGSDLVPPPAELERLTATSIAAHRLKRDDPELVDDFFADCGRVWAELGRLERDLRVAALADAAAFARRAVREAKDRAQILSFDDLLTEMLGALERDGGEAMAEAVRERFPVAMIDEFQDTDATQYGIFRCLYQARPDCGLILIGDPKQAIYGFRGGDIFTYMQAKEDVGEDAHYTLTTNWRSTPAVICAVNTVFGRRPHDAFVYGKTIPFLASEAAPKGHQYLTRDGAQQPALTLWTLPAEQNAKGEPKAPSKETAAAWTHEAVADEVARLIDEGRAGRALIGARPVAPSDIAVLVRRGVEAEALREVLGARGLGAVVVERAGVFASAEASALEMLLQAILSPRDRELARLALTSPLLGKAYPEIDQLCQDEDGWLDWVEALLALHEAWQRKGFMVMFQQMLRRLDLAGALSRGALPERRLTNLLHLGELLQQAAKAHTGKEALLGWYRGQIREAARGLGRDEAELRLESDAELVQLVTIHKSKGLEYPIVFVPYLWSGRPREASRPLAFHDGKLACLDAGSDAIEAHLRLAEQERLAEDVRLAYVALTRAEAAVYLVWGRAGSGPGHAGQTALGYLLHPHQPAARLAEDLPDAFAGLADLQPDLDGLAAAAPGDIAVAPLPEPAGSAPAPPAESPAVLAARPFRGRIATDWRIASFSALTREVHSGPALSRDPAAVDVGLRFPAGSQVGSYLHALLEELDFQRDVAEQVAVHSARIAPRFNLDHARWGGDAAALLERVIRTALNLEGLCLAEVSMSRRLNELEFDFATDSVDVPALNRLLAHAADQALPPLEIEVFQGLVNGVIDLVFEHGGRYYIADYKSNFLGGRHADYAPKRLREAVYERRYDLQYLLYTLALDRYLAQRRADYDYAEHFGGVYYLFLRGMRPETGPERGVYFVRPQPAILAELDRVVFRYPGLAEGRA